MKLINPTMLPRKNYVWGMNPAEPEVIRLYYIYDDRHWIDVISIIHPVDDKVVVFIWRGSNWSHASDAVDTQDEAMRIIETTHLLHPADITYWRSMDEFCIETGTRQSDLLGEQK